MNSVQHSPLGAPSAYPRDYDPALLYPIARAEGRRAAGLDAAPAFFGADLWTAYELSWLDPRGKPQVALARLTIPCETPNLIESKSLKLYLNSFNATPFASPEAVRERLRADLSAAAWRGAEHPATLGVQLLLPEQFAAERIQELDGLLLDRLQVECTHYQPAPELLGAALDEAPVEEVLVSHLLKSNCPVTGQPDWASVQIRYSGPQIDQAGLLRYLVSFRDHQGFHEQCVERIFSDIRARCRPIKLTVLARYTRRGGLDINPLRTSHPMALPHGGRTARQ
ncbi:NADPH-dependent 7-cyano-7-deazaguanine reductase QueF [Comamonas flocculans]|uniref:NADPH-dependent 7-cyano-7-deazaguanine reductase n=1 Tax=Comamonas flocculans TaxID=2597701 RepID=A0A5B8RU05_9BURK|nr:NADPH-dependent 7-cyano-7-deazaguanine reductase QueF [Comamonas flocculans]QEA12202.1 NADPH-dependent 7-cyano-7-deazaguanine reductase QueF [Comamonas flocculans]